MNLKELQAAGAFVAPEPVKVPVIWNDNTFDVYVKQLPFAVMERLMHSDRDGSISLIAASILLGENKEPMTEEQAQQLSVPMALVFLDAINKVNASPKA